MSDVSIWITLGMGLSGLSVTIIGTAIKLTWWLGDRFDRITTETTAALNAHEIRDQERQKEIIKQVTRLETIVLNGSGKHRSIV